MKQVVGIAGRETGYWVQLMEYMNGQGRIEAFVCTKEEYLEEEIKRRKPVALFREKNFAEDVNFSGQEIVFLTERTGIEGIYQYQSADQIYREMISYLFPEEPSVELKENGEKGIYAVYSPLGRSGKTSFALSYAREHSFFYLGMEDYGLAGESENTMGEILYYIRSRKEKLTDMMLEISELWQNVRLLKSPPLFQDVKQLSFEDYRWFFQQIRAEENFPSCIIDFGTGCLPDFEIFTLFDRIYVPVLDGSVESEKLKVFWNLLFEIYGEVDERFRIIRVPVEDWTDKNFLLQIQEKTYKEESTLL